MAALINANPTIYKTSTSKKIQSSLQFDDEEEYETIGPSEVYDHIKNLSDPEHPLTLEQLHIVSVEHITVIDEENYIMVQFTPTIPHCSMATLIGLSIRVKLLRSIPSRFKVVIQVCPGTHASEGAVNKQLNDKERVAAALENSNLLDIVNKSIGDSLKEAEKQQEQQ
jgi:metal-sulfur cluster biosynthetic enzyme